MMLRNKPICKLYAFGLALLFTVALAGCGGGGKKAAAVVRYRHGPDGWKKSPR